MSYNSHVHVYVAPMVTFLLFSYLSHCVSVAPIDGNFGALLLPDVIIMFYRLSHVYISHVMFVCEIAIAFTTSKRKCDPVYC